MPSAATILRRRYPFLTPPFVDDEDDWGQKPKLPIAVPSQLPPLVRPVEMSGPVIEPLPPTVDLGVPATVPIDSNIPLTITRRGRPAILPNLRAEDAARGQQQYTQAVRDYQPREEGWGKGLLRAGLGFLRGGIPGAVGTLGTWALDRRAADRNWREGELERSQQAEGMMADERRRGLQDRMLQLQLNRAENPPADYDWMPNPADPQGSDVYSLIKPGLVRPLRTKPSERRGFNLSPGQQRIEIGPDGKPVVVAELADRSKPAPAETPFQQRERLGRFRAAKQLLDDISQQEQAAAAAKDRAWQDYHNARSKWVGIRDDEGRETNPDIQDDVVAAKRAVDAAQAHYESFWGRKNEAKAEMLRYGDVDESGNPREPQARDIGNPNAPPATHSFSIRAYLNRNPGATEADAKAYAEKNYRGYRIVP